MSREKQTPDVKRQQNSRIWLIVSLVLTGIILFWAFSLPFRSEQITFTDPSQPSGSGSHTLAGSMTSLYDASDREFRAAAIALDKEFMRQRREETRIPKVPGKQEATQHWKRHVQRVHQQIQELGKPEKGTLEWQERQRLIRSLADGPE